MRICCDGSVRSGKRVLSAEGMRECVCECLDPMPYLRAVRASSTGGLLGPHEGHRKVTGL